jgi:hypothetical protein
MSELSNLLNKLRQTAGLTNGDSAMVETPHGDAGIPEVNDRTTPAAAPTEADFLLAAIFAWAGGDARRWNRLLGDLKRTWHPTGWTPETPRDLLVAWTSANFRLVNAQADLVKLEQLGRQTRGQRVARSARNADISFYSQLASGLKSWASNALQQDSEGFRILKGLCDETKEEQS